MQSDHKTGIIRRMAKLIINADDLGVGAETDRAILETFHKGIVSSASLLVNGASARMAAAQARDLGLPVGIHLNLSEGKPLGGPIVGLTQTGGDFAGKTGTRQRLASGTFDSKALRHEINAQIETALAWGLSPDHLDSHQHVFLFPGVTEAIIEAAQTFNIRRLRLPRPCLLHGVMPDPELQAEIVLYQQLAPAARDKIRWSKLTSPEGLFGLDCLNRLTTSLLAELLTDVPPVGCWELLVHPGHPDPDNPFSGPEREVEWRALTAKAMDAHIVELGIQLISYGELPCAS